MKKFKEYKKIVLLRLNMLTTKEEFIKQLREETELLTRLK